MAVKTRLEASVRSLLIRNSAERARMSSGTVRLANAKVRLRFPRLLNKHLRHSGQIVLGQRHTPSLPKVLEKT